MCSDDDLPEVENSEGPSGTGNEFQSRRTYSCQTGYVFQDQEGGKSTSMDVQCQVQPEDKTAGEWSEIPESCESKLPEIQTD